MEGLIFGILRYFRFTVLAIDEPKSIAFVLVSRLPVKHHSIRSIPRHREALTDCCDKTWDKTRDNSN